MREKRCEPENTAARSGPCSIPVVSDGMSLGNHPAVEVDLVRRADRDDALGITVALTARHIAGPDRLARARAAFCPQRYCLLQAASQSCELSGASMPCR